MYLLECGLLFIEKRNTCPNRSRRIHNVQVGVGDQNKEKKIFISTITNSLVSTLINIIG